MSLIYDALTDLDKRHAKQIHEPVSSSDANEATRSSHSGPSNFLIFFGIVFSCYLAMTSIQIKSNTQVPVEGAFADVQLGDHNFIKTNLVDKSLLKSNSPNSSVTDDYLQDQSHQKSSETLISTKNLPVESKPKMNDSSITVLLAKAEEAFSKQRYSVPESSNAVLYYNKVLALEPENERALIGLRNIAEAYLRLFEQALAQGNDVNASLMKERLIGVIEFNERPSYETMLAEIENTYRQRATEQIKEFENPSSLPLVNIRKSKHQIKDELLTTIAGLISSRKVDAARQLVLNELSAGGVLVASFEPMLAEFIEREQYSHAIDLLSILPKSDVTFTHTYALSIQAERGDEAALAFLQSRYVHDEKAGAIYAGLLQKYEHYSLAADVYYELTQQNTNNALYWLGLAVSLENVGQSGSAKSAYQTSLSLGGHSISITRFIQQRIRSINTDVQQVELSQW